MTTLGTRLFTALHGRLVGRDADGRAYYESRTVRKDGLGSSFSPAARRRRWVIYNGPEDASAVPAEWWNWLHNVDEAPLPASARRGWQIPFQSNRTGEPGAYRPPGSDYRGGQRPHATGDYEAWTPDA
ncbi:NADH-ubiquinone oxidoreductase subunit NDUFA12 family protein [Rhizosaccharibacter radicis]|uniref:NADH-ubiquinone oxidoreductase subunit NDUFA12 family protein n=1 Tax=Rhizosaccharibacter radicis TaxID=2782605 RepID=A0ABT1VZB9_9PROT|nr:NADH-ubiquinone oxidoreductase subunit NDUFA12 family protein [Acetobacteraceae bacterium KSS12]